MAITLNLVASAISNAGVDAYASITASGIGGTNGNLMVLMGFVNAKTTVVGHINTSITGTWSGTWTLQAQCYRDTTSSGQYAELVEIWTSPISGSPSGTVIYNNPATGFSDGWIGFRLYEISGQNASPIGLAANGTSIVSSSTFTIDFGATPASDSLVIGIVHDDNQTGPAVNPPSGWTEEYEASPSWGAITEWAYQNGGASQTAQWSGFTNSASVRLLGCGLEIKAAGGGSSPIYEDDSFYPSASLVNVPLVGVWG